jgi:hypothetical protein
VVETGDGDGDVNTVTTSAFRLAGSAAAKADRALIGADEAHFAAMARTLERSVEDLTERLDAARKLPGGAGQEAMERDLEIHRLTSRLGLLRRFGLDLCLGRMVGADGSAPVYVGRMGLSDGSGRRLLVDWRAPAAELFFGATHANPMGLASRRRYHWIRGRITNYWDEVFSLDGTESTARSVALDDQSAFIASLGADRSDRMRDVLGTIQVDQDAIIRAGSSGALVVDGGPGTGKTVVALHRTAYLMYAEPRLSHDRGGVLFVGPHQPYLTYVSDVLPTLGEEGVQICTLRDLVPQGGAAVVEADPDVERLKTSAAMVGAIEPAVRFYEEPPTEPMVVETPWAELNLEPSDWIEAFQAPDPDTPHNDARDLVWEELLTILIDKCGEQEVPPKMLRRSLAHNRDLVTAFTKAWPLIEYTDLVGDLWAVPAYLRMCAPWLDGDEVRRLRRHDPQAWTTADLPLLDAARIRLGDPQTSRRKRRRDHQVAADREHLDAIIGDLIAADDSEMMVMSMLRGEDLQDALMQDIAPVETDLDRLAGPFAHIVVDEAQELTDAQWQMLLRRCPSGSFTIVGDRAQARHGFTESWQERLDRVGVTHIDLATLQVNYRTPQEVMAEAEPVIRAVIPDANVPTSIRGTGVPVRYGSVDELDAVLDAWGVQRADGIACVIGVGAAAPGAVRGRDRVRWLSPELSKGLEFDLVVLIGPERFGAEVEGAVDRYVAMTRATHQLVVLTG